LFRDPNDKHFTNQAYLKDFLTTHKSDNFLKECIGIRNTSTGIEYFPLFTMLKVDFYDKSKKPISPLITIEINDHWKDDLLDAIQNYSLVKLKNIMSLNDKYSIKLYNLILSNLDHRHKEELQYFYIDLTKLKEFLGVPDNMYYCYRDKEAKAKGLKKFNRAAFQKRALEPALKEIIIKTNVKAHIYYTYKPGKKREKAYLFIAYEKYTPGDLYYGSPSNTVGKVGLYNIPYTIGDRDYDRITLKDFTTPSEQELEDLILEMQRQEPSKNLVDILSKRWVPKD
jgi:hypothetical protein